MSRSRTLTVNCGDDADCQCRQRDNLAAVSLNRDMAAHSVRITVNLSDAQIRTEILNEREFRVVPVVMARADVVMNGALVPESEFFPEAWNGVPVTVGHPETESGGFLSANDPAVLETWAVGQIFNARVEGGALKAEAWIDVAKANRVRPTLVDELTSGTMDVSTGYWSKDERKSGTINGKTYDRVSRDLLPDHLALLPGDVGACSWEDGCGVRNRREDMSDKLRGAVDVVLNALGLKETTMTKTKEQIVEELRTNKRGSDDDHRMIVADLISDDKSPYLPEDMYALAEMSHDSLVATRDAFLAAAPGDEEEESEAEANANAAGKSTTEGGQDLADGKNGAAKSNSAADGELPKTVGELNDLIANAVKSGIEGALPEIKKTASANALSDEDRSALEQARKIQANHRDGLIAKIAANSDISKEQAEKMDLATLETVANGLRTPGDYSGRPLPAVNSFTDEEAEEFGEVLTVDGVLKAHRENQKVN